MSRPRGMILQAPGINCDPETAHAVDASGGEAVPVHISELEDGSRRIRDFDMLWVPGGFSYGDSIRAGAILGATLRVQFAEELNDFVASGRPVVGVCNGYQTLVESGLLPAGRIDPTSKKESSLTANENGKFNCGWTLIKVGKSACRYISPELVDSVQHIPVANAEGRRVISPDVTAPTDQVVFSYVTDSGEVATSYPANPSGSLDGVAATCDPSGVVLGMMPHPERAFTRYQHQNWRGGEGENPFGAILFRAIINHAKQL